MSTHIIVISFCPITIRGGGRMEGRLITRLITGGRGGLKGRGGVDRGCRQLNLVPLKT